MFDLRGRVGLVTGGNSGIRLGYARGLAKAGARVAIWGRDAAKNAEAVAELEKLGTEAAGFACDVASEADVIAATPHVKYRTSIIVWIFLALVLAGVVLAVLMPMFR